MTIIDNPEQWAEQTGNKQTPRQELDRSLNKQIVSQQAPMGRMTTSMRAEREAAVTQEERDAFMPAHLYNEALLQRQQAAAEKTVRQIRRRELMPGFRAAGKYKQDIQNSREAWRRRGTKPDDVPYPTVPYYREGMDIDSITQSLVESELEYSRQVEAAQLRYLEGP
jgi:hypothetical protein